MGQTITLIASGGYYGWGSTSDAHTANAKQTFYAGHHLNGEKTAYHDYDAAVYFQPTIKDFGDGLPIVVTSVAFSVDHKTTPKGPLTVYLNTNKTAVPNASKAEDMLTTTQASIVNGKYDSSTFDFSVSRDSSNSGVLNRLAEWLRNGTSFVLHETGTDYDSKSYGNWGGKFSGYSESSKPKLTITWEYAATKGTLSANSYNTGSTAKLTIDPKDSSFIHTVTWKIGGITFTGTNSGNVYSCPISLTSANINSIFGNGKTASGEVSINTKTKDNTTDLGTEKYSFEVILTSNTCLSTGNIVFNSADLSVSYSNSISALGSKYVVGKSKIRATGKFNRANGSNVTASLQVVFSGGYSGTVNLGSTLNSSLSGTTSGYISSKKDIKASFILTDSRGLKYQIDKTILASQIYIYQAPIINTINFYRCSSTGQENVEGTYLGGNFQVTLDNNFISTNKISAVKLYYGSKTKTVSVGETHRQNNVYKYSSTNFANDLSSSSAYSIKLEVTDQIGEKAEKTFTLGTSEYIIHIPFGGKGLGLGAVGINNYINCGWPLQLQKGFKMGTNLDFSSVTTQNGFQKIIGGPFLPLSGGTMTGPLTMTKPLKIGSNNYIEGNGGNVILSYNYSGMTGATKGTALGSRDEITTIRGSELKYFKYINENSSATYDILHGGNYNRFSPRLSELYYQKGDTVEFTDGLFHGFVTNSQKNIYLIIPLSKRLDKINSVTINEMHGHIRNTGGYAVQSKILEAGNSFTSYTITPTIITENSSGVSSSIKLLITGKTWILNNNESVTFVPVSFKITFQ